MEPSNESLGMDIKPFKVSCSGLISAGGDSYRLQVILDWLGQPWRRILTSGVLSGRRQCHKCMCIMPAQVSKHQTMSEGGAWGCLQQAVRIAMPYSNLCSMARRPFLIEQC